MSESPRNISRTLDAQADAFAQLLERRPDQPDDAWRRAVTLAEGLFPHQVEGMAFLVGRRRAASAMSLAAVFVAQAAGIDLTVGQQVTMMLTLMLTSKGVAGVPRAALVILAATLASFQLPIEGVALLLGVDALMDMGRTMTNVIGNCLASVVVAKWEGEFREPSAGAAAS